MKKSKILIINPNQYGYSAGYQYYCRYLKDYFYIDFVCFDKGFTQINEPGVNIIYLNYSQNKVKRIFCYLFHILKISYNNNYNVIFCVYFRFAIFVGLFTKCKNKILDIRTGSLSDSQVKRFAYNFSNLSASLFFNKITVLSEDLARVIRLQKKKVIILPLGAVALAQQPKVYNKLHLVYIGTLYKRNIEKTIYGMKLFVNQYQFLNLSIKYDIIGYSHDPRDEALINESIENNDLHELVFFHGRLPHKDVIPFFENATIGVCFVPQNASYDMQPPTKLFEYALSGLITIATNTKENQKYISPKTGILCDDNAESFCQALKDIYSNLERFDTELIKKHYANYHWQQIIDNILLRILLS